MKRISMALLSGLLMAGGAWAEPITSHPGFFANPKEVFRPLSADPRELQLALRLTMPVSQSNVGDIAIGDYFGLYRWVLPWEDSYVQWSVGGGVFARFDLVSVDKSLLVNDYQAEMPVDIRIGKWSTRLLPYHISSHLGDDFIKTSGILPGKYSFDSFKWLFAYDPISSLRLYAGYNYVIRNSTVDLGRNALQAGLEWVSGWWGGGHAQTFWVNDFQSWQRTAWNPGIVTQLGVRLAHDPRDKQTLSCFMEYGSGPLYYGQLYNQKESHWVTGVRFDLL